MAQRVIIASKEDNVATALSDLTAGTDISLQLEDKNICILLAQDIPFGHKLALSTIRKGEQVIKYGESIGIATRDIPQGSFVHIHNVDSQRGRGDLEGKF
jgi:altronate dehydratase small subunit